MQSKGAPLSTVMNDLGNAASKHDKKNQFLHRILPSAGLLPYLLTDEYSYSLRVVLRAITAAEPLYYLSTAKSNRALVNGVL